MNLNSNVCGSGRAKYNAETLKRTGLLVTVLGAAAAVAILYALTLASPRHAAPPPPVAPPPPTVTEAPAPPPVAKPTPPPTVAAPVPAHPAPAAPAAAAPPRETFPTWDELNGGINDEQAAAIKSAIGETSRKAEQIKRDLKDGRLNPSALDETLLALEAETIRELSRTLGPERARQFVLMSRGGRMPERFRAPSVTDLGL